MKKLVGVLVLLGLLLVLDRAAAAVAATAIAAQVQSSTRVTSEPDVTVGGFPFLTQALAGSYDRVEVDAAGVPAGDLTVTRLEATLTGVRVPLSDAVSGSVERVPVDRVQARALVSYDELSRRSGDRRLTVSPGTGDRVRVTGSVQALGGTVAATAVARVEVADGALVVIGESYEVDGAPADAAVTRALRGLLDLRIPVTGLPYGLQVSRAEVGPQGVTVVATARDTVLSSG